MLAPTLLAADFLRAFQALLPRGLVWPRDPDAVQTRALAALMPTYERQAARAANLLVDSFPATTIELLPEWESTLGLPDPCAGVAPTIAQRRAQVTARFAGRGGQSVDYFITFAANLGFPIAITEFTPYRCGMPLGRPMNGEAWAFAWQVNAASVNVHRFTLGTDACGEPFATFGNAVLECELRRVAPAHATLIFSYSSNYLGSFVLGTSLLGGP